VKIEGLEEMAWGYVKLMSLEDLNSNKAYLIENLKPEDKRDSHRRKMTSPNATSVLRPEHSLF
jgi:hypothetical protein